MGSTGDLHRHGARADPPASAARRGRPWVGLTVTLITGTLEPDVALGGFSEPTIWLIVAAFFISLGFTKTGLGRRIALLFVRALGRSSLGLAYGITLTGLVLAPATPSNTARSGGVIHPVIRSLSANAGSHPATRAVASWGRI